MDYAAWKLFLDAAEFGSLSKVAMAYGTSQPHISRQIRDLEQECGGRLFERTGRGVVLTELGRDIAHSHTLADPDQCVLHVRRHHFDVVAVKRHQFEFIGADAHAWLASCCGVAAFLCREN